MRPETIAILAGLAWLFWSTQARAASGNGNGKVVQLPLGRAGGKAYAGIYADDPTCPEPYQRHVEGHCRTRATP